MITELGDGVQCYPLAGALTSSPTVHLLSVMCKWSTGLPPGSFRILNFLLLNLNFLVHKNRGLQRLFRLSWQFLSSIYIDPLKKLL